MTRPVSEWTFEDLQALILDQVQESLNLDYKASPSLDKSNQKKINELSKDVAAFANSDGGRIVYGIVEDKQTHLPAEIDAGVTDQTITREWIEQKLQSTIRPKIQGLIIKPILLPGGGWAFVIDIPKASTFAPHMSDDHKYYRRHNFESVPMESYEVEAAFKRHTAPDLFLDVQWSAVTAEVGGSKTNVHVSIGNNSPEPALYSSVTLFVDQAVEVSAYAQWTFGQAAYQVGGVEHPIQILHRNLVVPHHQPVFREKRWTLGSIAFLFQRSAVYRFGWRIEAPGNFAEVWGNFHIGAGRVIWAPDEVPPTA